jgi:hypothetical protein
MPSENHLLGAPLPQHTTDLHPQWEGEVTHILLASLMQIRGR